MASKVLRGLVPIVSAHVRIRRKPLDGVARRAARPTVGPHGLTAVGRGAGASGRAPFCTAVAAGAAEQAEQQLIHSMSAIKGRRASSKQVTSVIRDWGEVQTKRSQMSGLAERTPAAQAYGAAIVAYTMARAPAVALAVGDAAASKGVKLHRWEYKRLQSAAYMTHRVDGHMAVLGAMEDAGIALDKTDYEALLCTCLRCGDDERAEEVLEKLNQIMADAEEGSHEASLGPRVVTELSHRALVSGDSAAAARLLADRFALPEPPTSFDVRTAESILQSTVHVFAADEACIAVNCLLEADEYLDEGTIMHVMCVAAHRGHRDLSEALVTMAERAGYGLNAHMYNSLVAAYAKFGDLDSMFRTMIMMDNSGSAVDATVRDNVVTACLGRSGHSRGTDLSTVDRVRELLLNLNIESGVPVSVANVLLDVYGRIGLSLEALEVLRNLKVMFGAEPDAESYAATIEACSHPREVKVSSANALFEEMGLSGMPLCSRTFSAMATISVRDARPLDGLDFVEQAYDSGLVISGPAYESVVRGLARAQEYEKAKTVLETARSRGVLIDFNQTANYIERLRNAGGVDYNEFTTEQSPAVSLMFEFLDGPMMADRMASVGHAVQSSARLADSPEAVDAVSLAVAAVSNAGVGGAAAS